MHSLGYKTGEFITSDFFQFAADKNYDVVASFGFIKHFVDYKEVILKHAKLVNNNGYLIITTPNFRGRIQHWLHKVLDNDNLSKHNIESMNPQEWKNILEENGFEILYRGYFGDFWFWHGPEDVAAFKRKLLWFQSVAFSAYAGIVARKKINNPPAKRKSPTGKPFSYL